MSALAAPPLELHAIYQLREQELEEARTIQSVMQPSQPLRAATVTISHEFQPAAAVGGDYLDYFSMTDGMIGMYLGDVSGKGLPAALFAALAVGTLAWNREDRQAPEPSAISAEPKIVSARNSRKAHGDSICDV